MTAALVQPRWLGWPVARVQRAPLAPAAAGRSAELGASREPDGRHLATDDDSVVQVSTRTGSAERIGRPVGGRRVDVQEAHPSRSAERGEGIRPVGVRRAEEPVPVVPAPIGRSLRLDRAEPSALPLLRLPVAARPTAPDPAPYEPAAPQVRPLPRPDPERQTGDGNSDAAVAAPPRGLGLGAPVQRHTAGSRTARSHTGGAAPPRPAPEGAEPAAPFVGAPEPAGIADVGDGSPMTVVGPEIAVSAFRPVPVPSDPRPVVRPVQPDAGPRPGGAPGPVPAGGPEPAVQLERLATIGPETRALPGRPAIPLPDVPQPVRPPPVQRNTQVPGSPGDPPAATAVPVQRAPEPPPDAGTGFASPAGPAEHPGAAAQAQGAHAAAPPDVDALVRTLYDPLARRLKAELRLDRERAGNMLDLRH